MYTYFEENEHSYAVCDKTGELLDTINITVPIGSRIFTPEQQEACKKRKEIETQQSIRRAMMDELGYFYFVLCENQFEGLAPETVTRLILLCTYLNYNHCLMLTQRTPMKIKDLQNILGVSKSTVSRFWNEVNPRFLIEDEETKNIKLNTDTIFRGKIAKNQKGNSYQKFYVDAIRKLYKNTAKNNQKYLGYIFKLLPFINLEFNIICFNPDETELDKVVPMTLKEFCNCIDYNVTNVSRLLSIYRNLKFEVTLHNRTYHERFCTFVNDGINRLNSRIFINPRILYAGSDYTKVEILGAFCDDAPRPSSLKQAKMA